MPEIPHRLSPEDFIANFMILRFLFLNPETFHVPASYPCSGPGNVPSATSLA